VTVSKINRIQNVSGHGHCEHCCGSGNKYGKGWVFVGWSGVGTDQMAPCPHCEAGWEVEFPDKGKPPWGFNGYWQGKNSEGLEKTCQCHAALSSSTENKKWMKKLTEQLTAIGSEL
jgi:hypothetical protein